MHIFKYYRIILSIIRCLTKNLSIHLKGATVLTKNFLWERLSFQSMWDIPQVRHSTVYFTQYLNHNFNVRFWSHNHNHLIVFFFTYSSLLSFSSQWQTVLKTDSCSHSSCVLLCSHICLTMFVKEVALLTQY